MRRSLSSRTDCCDSYDARRLAVGPHIRWHPEQGVSSSVGRRLAGRKAARLQAEWQRLVRQRTQAESRPVTRWDADLTIVTTEFLSPRALGVVRCRAPDLPPACLHRPRVPSSVRRARGGSAEGLGTRPREPRNSRVDDVLRDAREICAHLSLPLLVYGHPRGSVLPDRLVNTSSLGDDRLLERELGYLEVLQGDAGPKQAGGPT